MASLRALIKSKSEVYNEPVLERGEIYVYRQDTPNHIRCFCWQPTGPGIARVEAWSSGGKNGCAICCNNNTTADTGSYAMSEYCFDTANWQYAYICGVLACNGPQECVSHRCNATCIAIVNGDEMCQPGTSAYCTCMCLESATGGFSICNDTCFLRWMCYTHTPAWTMCFSDQNSEQWVDSLCITNEPKTQYFCSTCCAGKAYGGNKYSRNGSKGWWCSSCPYNCAANQYQIQICQPLTGGFYGTRQIMIPMSGCCDCCYESTMTQFAHTTSTMSRFPSVSTDSWFRASGQPRQGCSWGDSSCNISQLPGQGAPYKTQHADNIGVPHAGPGAVKITWMRNN